MDMDLCADNSSHVIFLTGFNLPNVIERIETVEDSFVLLLIIVVFALTPATTSTTTVRTRSHVHLLCLRCVVPDPGGAPTSFWVRSRSLQDRRPVRL